MNKGEADAKHPPLGRIRCPVRGCNRRFSSKPEKDAHLYRSKGKAHGLYLHEHRLEGIKVPTKAVSLQEKQTSTKRKAGKKNTATGTRNPNQKKKQKKALLFRPPAAPVEPAWSEIGPKIEALSKQEIMACLELDWKGKASMPLLTVLAEGNHHEATKGPWYTQEDEATEDTQEDEASEDPWYTQEDVRVMLENNWYCEDIHEYMNIKALLDQGKTKLSFRTYNLDRLEVDLEALKHCRGKLDMTVEDGGCMYCHGSAEIKLRLKSNGHKTRLIVMEELCHACSEDIWLDDYEQDRRTYESSCYRYCIARGENGDEEVVSDSDDEVWYSD